MTILSRHMEMADFLNGVEACLCAREKRDAFWSHLAWLMAEKERNPSWSVREALDAVLASEQEAHEVGVQS